MMIRGFILLFVGGVILSACASGKAVKTAMLYSPAELEVTDINIDTMPDVDNKSQIRYLMRNAATNLALAYNENMGSTAAQYVMEISVQDYESSSPRNLSYKVILRNPDNGMVYRGVPVAYSEASSARGLIEESLPEAFQRLYGYAQTPENVELMLSSQDVFADPQAVANPTPTYESAPVVYSAPTTTTEPAATGEPKVITCAVC
ncbi:MAG: hypothetical protein AAF478_06380 [Pseudomonadota bacterium]